MVVDNPIPNAKREALIRAVEQTLDAEQVSIDSTSTAEGTYDYDLVVVETQVARLRYVRCKAKWHDDHADWEVTVSNRGPWRS